MIDLCFQWDENKARLNERKHRVSFREASTVFLDEGAVLFSDSDHSDAEDRFLLIGTSERTRVLVVSHCYRKDGDVIRIISAREATARERRAYTEL